MHEFFPFDKSFFSHKHKTAGFNYQIVLSTTSQKFFAIDGPYPAGANNDKIMCHGSETQQKLVAQNKRAITDGGYEGVKGGGVAIPNRKYHNKLTNMLLRRLRARHEHWNGRAKQFAIIRETFRFKKDRLRRHKIVFEAVAVIVATAMETKWPLFNP